MIDPDSLLAIPLLAGLNDDARRELAARSTPRTFAPGEVLWSAGAEPRGFFVVLEGEVRVVRSVGGRQHVIHVEGPGGTLGDVAMFAGERYPATAIASRRTTCVAVTRDGLLAAIRQDPELALALLGRLAGRVRQLIGRLDGATSRSVTARLAGYLLARRERAGRDTFPLGRTQAQVAEELGTVREVVVRTLRSLRDQGVIRAEPRGALTVLNAARLAELANT